MYKNSTITALAFLILLSGYIGHAAPDTFGWVPAEAQEMVEGEHASSPSVAMSVIHTSLPKPTANRANYKNVYTLDLKKHQISNDGTHPVETSKGINAALQEAKLEGKNLIIFPKGTYLISEEDPIILDHQDTIVDLNGATLKINPNGLHKYEIIEIRYGAKNLRLTNGTLKGDRYEHDYETVKATHESGATLRFRSGVNLEVDNILFTETSGFCVTSSKGMERIHQSGYRPVLAKWIESGGFSDTGEPIANERHCRTSQPYDFVGTGKQEAFDGEFEFGYIFGYGSFQGIFDRNYEACFYDQDMNFIVKKRYIQYKKNAIPESARYIHLEFNQPSAKVVTAGMVGSLTNLQAPVDVHFHNNRMYDNRSLGFAFCGGQRWVMENNVFEKNGGQAPSYGIDFEDGWDLMQDVVFRNNTFKDNVQGDVVVCAGSELLFFGNEFEKTVHVWGRTHNYTFENNRFMGKNAGFMTRTGGATIQNNLFSNCTVNVTYDRPHNDGIYLGDGEGPPPTPSITLVGNTFLDASTVGGTYIDLLDSSLRNVTLRAGKKTQLLRLRDCKLEGTTVQYDANGPEVTVIMAGNTGEITEGGPGLERKRVAH